MAIFEVTVYDWAYRLISYDYRKAATPAQAAAKAKEACAYLGGTIWEVHQMPQP